MSILYFKSSPDNEFKKSENELKSRWEKDVVWKEFKKDIISALKAGDDKMLQHLFMKKKFLIKFFANITHDHHMVAVDLRGLSLKELTIGKHDFSYCCLDYAEFENIVFKETGFQYSSLNKVKVINSKFVNVQASPISALNSIFTNTEFDKGFFMYSDFSGSKLENCIKDQANFELVLF